MAFELLAVGAVWVTLVPEDTAAITLASDLELIADAALADGGIIFLGDCIGDLADSGTVELADVLGVLAAWGAEGGHDADLDGDGGVGIRDLLVVLSAWGVCD